jgi:predicted enzyme related to lactoylglutathione lyase
VFTKANAFSSFSVDDLDAAKAFYGETLGLDVTSSEMGTLDIAFGNGMRLFAYPKPNHQPATFTVLNFEVDDIDKAVDELNARGVKTKIYADGEIPDMPPNDERGIVRGGDYGPSMAWFKDPAGNVIAVMESS